MNTVADQADRDAVAAILADHHWDVSEDFTYLWCVCGWRSDDHTDADPRSGQHARLANLHVAEVLAPLLAQARAEAVAAALAPVERLADTHRETAESMTALWQTERIRADGLEGLCDRLAERLVVLPDLWREEGRGVMFNRNGDDLTPQGRVGKWLHNKTTVTDSRAAVAAQHEEQP